MDYNNGECKRGAACRHQHVKLQVRRVAHRQRARKGPRACYNCGGRGHLAKACRAPAAAAAAARCGKRFGQRPKSRKRRRGGGLNVTLKNGGGGGGGGGSGSGGGGKRRRGGGSGSGRRVHYQ
jgi:hypothetical protein